MTLYRVEKNSFTGGEWSPSMYMRSDIAKYITAARQMKNWIIHPHGPASTRAGSRYISEVKESSKRVRLVPFEFSVLQTYVLEFGDGYMRIFKDGGRVVYPSGHEQEGDVAEVVSPYAEGDLELLKYTQSADTLYVVHPSHPPRKLMRADHHEWEFEEIVYGAKIDAPADMRRTAGSGSEADYVVTAVNADGEESVKSNSVSGGPGDSFAWGSVTGADYYNIYKDNKASNAFRWIAQAEKNSFKEPSAGIDPDDEKSPPIHRNPFDGADNYPGTVMFFEQRLLFARTNSKPQTIWGSVTGSFENMNISSPLRDDDAYCFTINAFQVNEIRWMLPVNELLIGTVGSEYKMSSGNKSNAVTASSVSMKMQSKWGSSHRPPVLIGSTVLFVENSLTKIRDLAYSLEQDGYVGNDLTIFAEHLFDGYTITDWAYQQDPDSIIWCVRSDGILLGLTYFKEHDVWGWHRFETEGVIENVKVITSEYGRDDVYIVVKRTVGGEEKRFVEILEEKLPDNDIKKAWCVDCGLQYSGDPVTVISGLEHLEGKSVAVLADGSVVTGKTVSGGQITLDTAASTVTVGLGYECYIELLDFVFRTEENTVKDLRKDIGSALIELENTRALWVGTTEGNLTEIQFRTDELPGDPTRLYTGSKEVNLSPGLLEEVRLHFKVFEPLPAKITNIAAKVEISG